ncbi:protein kinase family protein [Cryobacterium sp. N19]|uniref:protein kinase family protein n=1 Tax=Cryobacterium sp. N19 TaxID=2048288 RepID=UPI000CE4269D|nr:protein kinase family protein [Cryobacterium sp. N19]
MATQAERDAWKSILLGQRLGDYEIQAYLGAGFFGLVFEAQNLSTNARVAVKVLLPSSGPGAIVDFENEAVLLQKLNGCDGVITYVDGGQESIDMVAHGVTVPMPIRFHVLAVASGSVDELILDPVERSKLDWTERIRIFRGAVKSVHQMHLAGVAHRDLKSSNCLLMVNGSTTKLRLGDLGRAKDLRSPPTMLMDDYIQGRGDLRFAAPEFLWLQGGDTASDFMAADYYGLGSLLVEIATGQPLTSLALGNVGAVLHQAAIDLQRGQTGDLATLNLQYRRVIAEVMDLMPRSIQRDAQVLLASLCDPLPTERLAHSPCHRDRHLEPLEWVLRRADIMIRRLEIDAREERRIARKLERAAS